MGLAGAAADLDALRVAGEADRASAARRLAAADCGVERFIALLRDVQGFELSRLAAAPLEPIR
jgi:hypothetical protein